MGKWGPPYMLLQCCSVFVFFCVFLCAVLVSCLLRAAIQILWRSRLLLLGQPMLRTQNKIDSMFSVSLFAWRDLLFEVVAQSGLSELWVLHKSGEKCFVSHISSMYSLWVWTLGLNGRILGHSRISVPGWMRQRKTWEKEKDSAFSGMERSNDSFYQPHHWFYSLQKKEKLYQNYILLLFLCTFLIKSSRLQ